MDNINGRLIRVDGDPIGDEDSGCGPAIQDGPVGYGPRSCLYLPNGRYGEGLCLACCRVDIDIRSKVCNFCGGPVPLVHHSDTPAGKRRVREKVEELRNDLGKRIELIQRFGYYLSKVEPSGMTEGEPEIGGVNINGVIWRVLMKKDPPAVTIPPVPTGWDGIPVIYEDCDTQWDESKRETWRDRPPML